MKFKDQIERCIVEAQSLYVAAMANERLAKERFSESVEHHNNGLHYQELAARQLEQREEWLNAIKVLKGLNK